jgi:hypothetical protein
MIQRRCIAFGQHGAEFMLGTGVAWIHSGDLVVVEVSVESGYAPLEA